MAFRFLDTGTSDKVSYTNAPTFDYSIWRALSMWLYLDAATSGMVAFSLGASGSTSTAMAVYLPSGGGSQLDMFMVNNSYVQRGTASTAIATWLHFLATWTGVSNDRTSITLYVNGVEASYDAGQGNDGDGAVAAATGTIQIGNLHGQTRAWDGAIADVALVSVAPNAAQIAALAKGVSAGAVFPPAARLFYDPCIRQPYDQWKGQTGTATTVAIGDHPRITLPAGGRVGVPVTAAAPSFHPAWARNANVVIGF